MKRVLFLLFLLPSASMVRAASGVDVSTTSTTKISSDTIESPIAQRIRQEERADSVGSFLIPHKPNYILPLSYNSNPNDSPAAAGDPEAKNIEAKFQISLKIPVGRKLIYDTGDLFFTYTQLSM
jgi:phospholipase A1